MNVEKEWERNVKYLFMFKYNKVCKFCRPFRYFKAVFCRYFEQKIDFFEISEAKFYPDQPKQGSNKVIYPKYTKKKYDYALEQKPYTPTPWLTLLLVLGKSRVKQNSS